MSRKGADVVTGSCLCGGVQFTIDAELPPIQVCHCVQCREAQGVAIATNTPIPAAAFTLLGAADLITAFESSPGKQRCFCKVCGSPIYSYREARPDILRIRAGLINEPLAVRPEAHYHVASKCNWWDICDDLPQHE
jgi:hypothetical protein